MYGNSDFVLKNGTESIVEEESCKLMEKTAELKEALIGLDGLDLQTLLHLCPATAHLKAMRASKYRVSRLRKTAAHVDVIYKHRDALNKALSLPNQLELILNSYETREVEAFAEKFIAEDFIGSRRFEKVLNFPLGWMYALDRPVIFRHGKGGFVDHCVDIFDFVPDLTVSFRNPILSVSSENEFVITTDFRVRATPMFFKKSLGTILTDPNIDVQSGSSSDGLTSDTSASAASSRDATMSSRKRKRTQPSSKSLKTGDTEDVWHTPSTDDKDTQSPPLKFSAREMSIHEGIHRQICDNCDKFNAAAVRTNQQNQSSALDEEISLNSAQAVVAPNQSSTGSSQLYSYLEQGVNSFVNYIMAPVRLIRTPSLLGVGKMHLILDSNLEKVQRLALVCAVDVEWPRDAAT